MRVLIAHKYFFPVGGTFAYISGLMGELAARGHEVIPFSVAFRQSPVGPYSKYSVSPPVGDNAAHLQDIRLNIGAMIKLLGRATYSFETYRKALALVDATNPDVAYVHNIYTYMSPSMLRAFAKRRVPIVMRVSDYNMVCAELHLLRDGCPCTECLESGFRRAIRYKCAKGSLLATAGRVFSMHVHRWLRLYDLVDVFLAPSKCMKEMLIRASYPADKMAHLPSFVRLPLVRHVTEGDYVLYFGRVSREKGLSLLIEAISRLPASPRLIIAGQDYDGEQARLESLASSRGASQVAFLGHREPNDIERLIRGCLFSVVPSLWYDNSPMSVLESFAQAKAVIGSNIGGIVEQISPDCGLLFEPGNAADLADKMRVLVTDARLRKQMGAAARKRVEKEFSADAHCNKLVELFRHVIGVKASNEGRAPVVSQ